jgi:hypothetical protein
MQIWTVVSVCTRTYTKDSLQVSKIHLCGHLTSLISYLYNIIYSLYIMWQSFISFYIISYNYTNGTNYCSLDSFLPTLIVMIFLVVTSHQHCKSHKAIFQLHWRRKTSGTHSCIISGTNRHLSRTTDIPYASWIAFSHEKIQSPWQDLNPLEWGTSGIK